MTEAQKNQPELSNKEGLLYMSVPLVIIGAIMTFIVLGLRESD